ncbi:MAG: ABZJ_00895 family protein [Helicobacteraceae bacterium]|nr:ABZJ_00895 family protein [Helicobacteraceae bacterium]
MKKYTRIYAACVIASIFILAAIFTTWIIIPLFLASIAIPAKVFADDRQEPPTEKQNADFAIGASLVNAIPVVIVAFGFLSAFVDNPSLERRIDSAIPILLAFAIPLAITYFCTRFCFEKFVKFFLPTNRKRNTLEKRSRR